MDNKTKLELVCFFILMSLSIFIIAGNFLLIIQNEIHGLRQTTIPLVGGLLGVLAFLVFPYPLGGVCLIPVLIDPGSTVQMVLFARGLWKKKFLKA